MNADLDLAILQLKLALENLTVVELGDIEDVEIGMDVVKFGKSSLILKCEVRNKLTRKTIIKVENITMVNLGPDGKPAPHGKTEIEFVKDRLNQQSS